MENYIKTLTETRSSMIESYYSMIEELNQEESLEVLSKAMKMVSVINDLGDAISRLSGNEVEMFSGK